MASCRAPRRGGRSRSTRRIPSSLPPRIARSPRRSSFRNRAHYREVQAPSLQMGTSTGHEGIGMGTSLSQPVLVQASQAGSVIRFRSASYVARAALAMLTPQLAAMQMPSERISQSASVVQAADLACALRNASRTSARSVSHAAVEGGAAAGGEEPAFVSADGVTGAFPEGGSAQATQTRGVSTASPTNMRGDNDRIGER